MQHLLMVGAGGFIGAILRYLLAGAIHQWLDKPAVPWGTIVVNLLGSFLIGLLGGLVATRQSLGEPLRLFLLVGILGSFTTFSTFSYETLALLRDGNAGGAFLNIAVSVAIGLLAAFAGYALATSGAGA